MLAIALLAFAAMAFSPQAHATSVSLLVTGDHRGFVTPIHKFGSACSADDVEEDPDDCYGGVTRRGTVFDQLRARAVTDGSVTLDLGNMGQTTAFFRLFKGRGQARLYNLLGYDVHSYGRTEFYFGTEV